jgi:integrase
MLAGDIRETVVSAVKTGDEKMARTKGSSLSIKAKRLALPIAKRPIFESLGGGISVGYRRNKSAGTWVARKSDGKGGKFEKAIGAADDYADADGTEILSWAQAQAAAFAYNPTAPKASDPVTLRKALDAYEADLKVRGGDTGNVARVRCHMPDALLKKEVVDITRDDLKTWRDGLAEKLAPATINRTCNGLKAALNLAADGDDHILTRNAWEKGLASIPDAERPRNIIIPDSEIEKIIRAAYQQSEAFGVLVEVAAATGNRYSQLAAVAVQDLQDGSTDPRLMIPSSKKGKGVKKVLRRPVPITKALAKKLRVCAGERDATAPLLVKPSGEPWAKSDHARPFTRAVAAADLDEKKLAPYKIEDVTFYALRHSSIVRQALRGVPLRVVAALHDTSVVMIERTYSANIADHSDTIARAALVDFGAPKEEKVVAIRGRK